MTSERWVYYNPNPHKISVDDCAIRAIAKALNISWYESYDILCAEGRSQGDLPSANNVWGSVLRYNGFMRHAIPNTCPDCYSVYMFCYDNPTGLYVLGTGTHVVTVEDGLYFDSWDSGKAVPVYLYRKERNI